MFFQSSLLKLWQYFIRCHPTLSFKYTSKKYLFAKLLHFLLAGVSISGLQDWVFASTCSCFTIHCSYIKNLTEIPTPCSVYHHFLQREVIFLIHSKWNNQSSESVPEFCSIYLCHEGVSEGFTAATWEVTPFQFYIRSQFYKSVVFSLGYA